MDIIHLGESLGLFRCSLGMIVEWSGCRMFFKLVNTVYWDVLIRHAKTWALIP